MDPSTPQPSSEEDLFARALELAAGERARWLDEACAGQPRLRARLEVLLQAATAAGNFLEAPPGDVFAQAESRRAEVAPDLPTHPTPEAKEIPIGERIGRYKLLQKIGEGGCGAVYLAEQEAPVRRRVALKVIKLGMDTKEVIARFQAERQALALMDHPHIARVFDAGSTETGRPYFVMELVRGIPITKFCDEQSLPTRDRLELFTSVCHAVQHAHQKGVIHRDLKPSNILVTLHDGIAVPKVIDFGIAKATQGRLTDSTLFTAFEQFIGTPAYMSPEQAEMSGLDVDTRADIYSLGVLLYELLTGRQPFDAKSLLHAGLDEIRRIIREVDPPRPSTRLSTLADADLATIAKQRGISAVHLSTLLRGDLDWIVMRCLEKDRTRRYETANGLALDVLRHLHDEAVLARPPTWGYQFRKLIRRHRGAFAAAGGIAAALVTGLVASTWAYSQEKAARARAVAAEQEQIVLRREAELARERAIAAEQEQSRLRQVAEFSRQEEVRQRTLAETAEKNQASLRLQAEAARNEEARQRALAEAARHSEASLRVQAQADAVRSAQVARFLKDMLNGVGPSIALGRDTTLLRELLDRTAARLKKDLKDQPAVEAELRSTIGEVYQELGDFKPAEAMARAALRLRQALWSTDHPDVASSLRLLAVALAEQRDPACEPLFHAALAMRRRLFGEEHVEVAQSLDNMAQLLTARREFDQAEAMERQALAIRRKLLGAEAPEVAKSLDNLANILRARGAEAAAIDTLRAEALAIRRKVLGEEHPDVASSLGNQGTSLLLQGDVTAAEEKFSQVLARLRKLHGQEHPEIANALTNLGITRQKRGNSAGAESALREAIAMRDKLLGPHHIDNAGALYNLGAVLEQRGDQAGAEAAYRRALALQRTVPGFEPALTAAVLTSLGSLHARSDSKGAETMLREALALLRILPEADRGFLGDTLNALGVVLAEGNNLAEAERYYREALAVRRQLPGRNTAAVTETLLNIGSVSFRRGDLAGAESAYHEALALQRERLGHDHPDTFDTVHALGHAYSAQNKYAEAARAFSEATKVDPKIAETWNDLAWLRATAPIPSLRDGAAAIAAARKACELTEWKNAAYLDTLAAAHAEAGEFDRAVKFQQEALAAATWSQADRKALQDRLALYLAHQPFRQAKRPSP